MTNHVSLVAGLLTGLAIAAPIGPLGLLCIQRTLAAGMAVGVCTGLGAATVNVIYAAVILLGLDTLTPWMAGAGRVLSAAGGLFLLWSAARTLVARRANGALAANTAPSPLGAYGSALAFNATNPLGPILIVALLSPIVGQSAPAWADAVVFLFGMFTAAMTWWVGLSAAVTLLRARLSPAMLGHVNRAAGLLLTLYGALALVHAAQM